MQSAAAIYERYPHAASRPLSPQYRRREPDKTALYTIVNENIHSCLQQARKKSDHGYGYPRFVEREFENFLRCGLLRHGFVRVQCANCQNEQLVAFSCKGRGICPSCTARRMANTAAHLVDHVLPEIPYRQWVISFPKRVRFLLARDHQLLSRVLDSCLKKIFAWQRRKARSFGVQNSMCGAITFCQRFGSLLNLNCHFHSLLPDGVFADTGGQGEFVPLPPPSPLEIERIVRQMARATEKQSERYLRNLHQDDPCDILSRQQAHSVHATAAFRRDNYNRKTQSALAST